MSEIIDVKCEELVDDWATSLEKLLAYKTESGLAINRLNEQVSHLAQRIVGIETMLVSINEIVGIMAKELKDDNCS